MISTSCKYKYHQEDSRHESYIFFAKYSRMNNITTVIERTAHNKTSSCVNVRMDVDPNNVLHTSPERFGPVENIFIKRYPIASVPTINAYHTNGYWK